MDISYLLDAAESFMRSGCSLSSSISFLSLVDGDSSVFCT